MENFELLFEGTANNVIPVYKYKSKNTGLQVVIAQVGGPVVNGYFCLATEAHDDDGLPHTLEHLVFMGSEQYPYKGVLDLLANRCLASGTNAWTDTDHTCYTMTTAGSEGFLNLMPIYLDHILYPTLTDSGYLTEVHHVNEDGEDAGIVYCEMQARENSGESLTHLALLRQMYPGANCGYRAETGGILNNIRESTSHKKVCDYHAEFYRPENLCLIITGQVKPEDVFARLQPFENKIRTKGKLPPYVRPWQSPVEKLPDSVEQTVKYSSDEEEHGLLTIGWRGPKAKEQYTVAAIMMMMEYLTETSVAPLERDFVQVPDPYCSTVSYSIIENLQTCVYVSFGSVPMEKLRAIPAKLHKLLETIADAGAESVDMTRMASVIHRRVLEARSHIEDQPHDTIAFHVIGEFLYGNTKEDMKQRLHPVTIYKKLGDEKVAFWLDLLKTWFVGQNTVTILGEPSKKMMEQSSAVEKKRVEDQRKKLGDKGLKQKQAALEKATVENEKVPPASMISAVDVPDVGCIQFHNLTAASNASINTNIKVKNFKLNNIPVRFQLDDIQTNFVMMSVLMDTASLPADLRLYLPLYTEALLESPIIRDDQVIPHDTVIAELASDTLSNNCCVGAHGGRFSIHAFEQLVTLSLKVEEEKYGAGIRWLHELLYKVHFTADRLKVVITKIINDVARMKRDGRTVVNCLLKNMLFNKSSNHTVSSMLRQHKFLTALLTKLESEDGAGLVLADLQRVKDFLTRPNNLRVHMAARTASLGVEPEKLWMDSFLPKGVKGSTEIPIAKSSAHYLLDNPINPDGKIIAVGSEESNHLVQTTPCVHDYNHPELAAIQVFIQYLTQLEGPMWRQIRGLGLSYHYCMVARPEEGLLYFLLYKSSHIVNAYKQAKDIVDGYLSGSTPWSELELESAKSSLIFEIIEKVQTPSSASYQSMLSYLRGVKLDHNRQVIKNVATITIADLKNVGIKYFGPLFDAATSKVAVVCNPSKVKDICEGMEGLKREITVVESLEDPVLTEL